MGKFLKILRYIANLIAIMGASTSTPPPPPPTPNFSINSPDFIPEEPISDNGKPCFIIENLRQYQEKRTEYEECFPNGTLVDRSPSFLGSGRIPASYPNGIGSLKQVYFPNFENSPSVSIFRTRNGFVMKVGTQMFNLSNFHLFLEGKISTGDFLDVIFVEYPTHYNRIWEILNSSRQYRAVYYTGLFDAPLRRLKTVKNEITGDIIRWSVGQFTPKLVYDGREHDISNVFFRKNMETVAKISFPSPLNFFKTDPILHIGGHEYPLPDYIRVLSRKITEEQFIEGLHRNYFDSDVERIWKALTDREVLYRSIY